MRFCHSWKSEVHIVWSSFYSFIFAVLFVIIPDYNQHAIPQKVATSLDSKTDYLLTKCEPPLGSG